MWPERQWQKITSGNLLNTTSDDRITAGADTFSDRKNETSKCCDISFDLLKVKTSSEKQVERRDHLRTLLR